MSAIDPSTHLFDSDDSPAITSSLADADTSFASVEMNHDHAPSAPPPMGSPPPLEEDSDGTLIITVRL